MRKILALALILTFLCGEVFAYTVDGLTYTYRKKITVQTANVDADQTNFPLLVHIAADVDIGDESNADGFDIRFTQSDGSTLLYYERESWSGGGGAAVTADFWVATNIADGVGESATDIYIYYRSTDTADGADPANVWDANFMSVWHLKDLTTSTIADSATAADTDNGTKKNANEPIETTTAKVYRGQDWDGLAQQNASDYIVFNNSASLNIQGSITISAWINADTVPATSGYDFIFEAWYTASPYNGYGLTHSNIAGTTYFRFWSNGIFAWRSADTAVTTGAYHYRAVTGNTGDSSGVFYYDGAPDGTFTYTAPSSYTGLKYMGNSSAYSAGTSAFDGKMDEFRISNIARSAAWIKFEYANMNEADQELTWGAEESEGAPTAHPQLIIITGG